MKKLKENKQLNIKLTLALIVACLVILVSNCSYEDEKIEDDRYCEMVGSGAWGDYNPDIPCDWRVEK